MTASAIASTSNINRYLVVVVTLAVFISVVFLVAGGSSRFSMWAMNRKKNRGKMAHRPRSLFPWCWHRGITMFFKNHKWTHCEAQGGGGWHRATKENQLLGGKIKAAVPRIVARAVVVLRQRHREVLPQVSRWFHAESNGFAHSLTMSIYIHNNTQSQNTDAQLRILGIFFFFFYFIFFTRVFMLVAGIFS